MDTTDASALSNLFPKYAAYISAGIILIGVIGRIYHAVSTGGGLMGIWNALVRGSSPTVTAGTQTATVATAPSTPAIVPTPPAPVLPPKP